MANILVIRFSALGDVAMTVPILYSLAKQYPQHQITMLSRSFCQPMFSRMPDNFHFMGVDLKKDYDGIKGLNRLYRELADKKFDYIADLHSVLRTHYLDLRFLLSGKKVCRIDKGRKGKKLLTRKENKVFEQQTTSFERYRLVFEKLGLPLHIEFNSILEGEKTDYSLLESKLGKKGDEKWIGIAPFAKHNGKIYPTEKMEEVIRLLSTQSGLRIFLFGGGAKEKALFEEWSKKYPIATSMAGVLRMDEEIKLMSLLDVMVSMDSANMHLASLVGTKVISIWGATHPYAGFMGWGQSAADAIQLDMPCRPCSVFGQKPCHRGDYACMNNISPKLITERIKQTIQR